MKRQESYESWSSVAMYFNTLVNTNDLILNLPWLQKHNHHIDFRNLPHEFTRNEHRYHLYPPHSPPQLRIATAEGCEHNKISPDRPQTKGQIERLNDELIQRFQRTSAKKYQAIPFVENPIMAGDLVMKQLLNWKSKLHSKWDGSFVVYDSTASDAYQLATANGYLFLTLQTSLGCTNSMHQNGDDISTTFASNAFSKLPSTDWKPRSVDNVLIWTTTRRSQLSRVVGRLRERPLHKPTPCPSYCVAAGITHGPLRTKSKDSATT